MEVILENDWKIDSFDIVKKKFAASKIWENWSLKLITNNEIRKKFLVTQKLRPMAKHLLGF